MTIVMTMHYDFYHNVQCSCSFLFDLVRIYFHRSHYENDLPDLCITKDKPLVLHNCTNSGVVLWKIHDFSK